MQRKVVQVGGESGRPRDRRKNRRGGGGIQLLLGPAAATVKVPVLRCLLEVVCLTPVRAVVVARQAEIFEEVEGAVDR